ncbi:2-C-methyl-D-erythritol 4-phosphate cytidylyltransferase [Colwellia sp. RSH04]|uniref:2-C-methyl-D-erythritol 4-phosphate cytidylyltransferase n=1 Tax=Colwellia sp. RSH04 TaxID=2305464 RepID=UPI000E56FBB7|nr:2-C-methyl-D-erythritol 4-phosphate cytidylyltransferase [Colwellia sp. RSH04]RHW77504.1 2-C-methyl-D-erythritol 4-phosphate cytidylyltransferase [Colwellia sp. RSH04]
MVQKPHEHGFVVVVPAAGVGKRMQANCPKQYLTIHGKPILAHTVDRLLSHPKIEKVILSLGKNDQYFAESNLAEYSNIIRVDGGKERVDSVLNGLRAIDADKYPWVLVHDAARPCVQLSDIDKLISKCLALDSGGLLASPVRDTMKRGEVTKESVNSVCHTVQREQLWHALTPQLYKTQQLLDSIESALAKHIEITDESSAIEQAGLSSLLVSSSHENIKITHPDDLALAAFILTKQGAQQLNTKQCKELQ